jgi:hypothetical protein
MEAVEKIKSVPAGNQTLIPRLSASHYTEEPSRLPPELVRNTPDTRSASLLNFSPKRLADSSKYANFIKTR